MKYIKKYEKYLSESLSKKYKKDSLSEENEKILKTFIFNYIDNKDILSKVKKLKFSDIEQHYFEYENIFDDLISDNKINYQEGVIYYDTDKFIRDSGMKLYSSLIIRDCMIKIIDRYWEKIKNDFSKILDNKLINYFNKHHDDYEINLTLYGDEISDNVKKECQWIIDHQKYNL